MGKLLLCCAMMVAVLAAANGFRVSEMDNEITGPFSEIVSESSEIPTTSDETEEDAEVWFKCPAPEGLFRNPRNCSSFIQCAHGKPNVMPCPKGLHFSEETKRCEQQCEAYCNGTLSCKCEWKTCGLPRICFLPKETGPCHASKQRYFFNKRTGQCEQFLYGGCRGNKNNFETKEACEKRCSKSGLTEDDEISEADEQLESRFKCVQDGLYPNPRNCSTFIQCSNGDPHVMPCPKGLHYSVETKRCERQCEAYCNRTLSCDCKWPTCGLPSTCFLPKETGPCKASKQRYFFNKRTGQCEQFLYGGCRGNKNNFETKEACEKRCSKSSFDDESQLDGSKLCRFCPICPICCILCSAPSSCQLPKEVGPCNARLPRYYFNKESAQCEEFTYGGCKGNENNYRTKEECEERCSKGDLVSEESSEIPTSEEEEDLTSWFRCPIETGLFRNPRNCSSFIQCSNGKPNVMPCPKGLHFSEETKRCERPCEAYCNRTLSCKCEWKTCGLDRVCFLPKETGPCRASIPRYFFNKRTGVCEKFTYGGCKGNANNFETKEACEKRCSKSGHSEDDEISVADEQYEIRYKCLQDGLFPNQRNCSTFIQCSNGKPHVMPCPKGLHFSVETKRCEQQCEAYCNRTLSCECKWPTCGLSRTCFLPKETGPCHASKQRYFFNKRTGQCEQFIYGGCKGNSNNFETKEACEKRCTKSVVEPQFEESKICWLCPFCTICCVMCIKGPVPPLSPSSCQLPKEVGPCNAHLPRYYFDKESGRCEEFIYGGCKGNENNYRTKEECEAKCSKGDLVSEESLEISTSEEVGDLTSWFRCPIETGLFRNPRNCSSFIQCSNGKPNVMPCPKGLHFSEETKRCEQQCEAYCNRTLSCECKWPTCGLSRTCFLPKETGPCHASKQRYFFNKRTGQCEQFMYGGCKGNSNNFETKEACEKRCSKSSGDYKFPMPNNKMCLLCPVWPISCIFCLQSPSCQLPKEVGPCNARLPRYHYNKESGQCEEFTYGGCEGNVNNYRTKEECEQRCKAGESLSEELSEIYNSEEIQSRFQCPFKTGLYPNPKNCSSFIQCSNGKPNVMPCPKGLHFSEETKRCERPCEAYCNRTLSCKCEWKTCDLPRICFLPKETGPCRASIPRYFFNKRTGVCEKFTYGGCKGNANNFETKEECEKRCSKSESRDEDISAADEQLEATFKCFKDGLYPNPRNCSSFIQCSNGNPNVMPCPKGLHYSVKTKRCEEPCKAYCNRTLSCQCKWPTCGLPDLCFLPSRTGPCRAKTPRFFFNKRTGKCERFIYGGCRGNSNNFETKEACEKICKKIKDDLSTSESREVFTVSEEEERETSLGFKCVQDGLFRNPRSCNSFIQCSNGNPHVMPCPKGLHFSEETKRCEQQCEAYCKSTLSCKCKWPTCGLPRTCFLSKETGPCRASVRRYFFNKRSGQCEEFIYGGCKGNSNNFETKEACEKKCSKKSEDEVEEAFMNVCRLDKNHGPCAAKLDRFYFDYREGKCKKFVYGGCGGNENRFKTFKQCEDTCLRRQYSELDSSEEQLEDEASGLPRQCSLPSSKGPCHGSITRVFFNARRGKCEMFIYGGCFGNDNNFETKAECEKTCRNTYSCPAANGDFRDPFNAEQFIRCKDNKPEVHRCEPSTKFSESRRACVNQEESEDSA